MALSFSKTYMNIRHAEGRRFRVVTITLDAAYVNGTGWSITPTNVDLTTKIEMIVLGNARGYALVGSISGNNAVIRAYRTGAALSGALEEAATNEAGLNGLTAVALVIGN